MKTCRSNRRKVLASVSLMGMLVLTLHSTVSGIPAESASAVFTECADGIDNDHDGRTDYPQDPQCLSLHDDSEGPTGRGLFVDVSDAKDTIHAGGSLTYIISLRTEREDPISADVFFQMPHQTNLIGTSDGGARNEELIRWNGVTVFPGRVRKITVTVEVDPDAANDLLLVAQVAAEGEKATDTTRVEMEDDSVISSTPLMNISVTDGKKYVQPGETLEYLVAVRNPTSSEREYDLRLQIPTDTSVEYVSGENHSANRKAISWSDQKIGPHGAREYKVVVRIAEDSKEFFMIRTRASIGAAVSTDTTTVHTGILPNAIIATTTDGLDEIVPGALVTYDIGLQNGTSQLATEVDLANALPSYLEFVDASEGGYWTGTNVRWENMTVAPNGRRSLRVTGRVRSDAPLGERLRNTVSVNGYESVDTTVVGSTVSGKGLAQRSDILVSKNADRGEVRPGEKVGYTVSISNTTNRTLHNVRVEDRMRSPHIRVLNAQSGQLANDGITWTIPTLAPGQSWDTAYTAQIDYRAPHGVTIPNIVTVSGRGMDTVSLEDRIYTSQIGVISNLPPTGAAFDALFLGLTGLAGAAQTLAQRRKYLKG
tara:strand:- start:370 stop:2157 length:1788 start_codon:yes stop_codon:yes gene_type:complete